MNEYWLGTVPLIQMIIVLAGAYLYMIGGREAKWHRRYLSPVFTTLAVVVGAVWFNIFTWGMLLLLPVSFLQYLLGYGIDVPPSLTRFTEIKRFRIIQGVIRRGRYAILGVCLPAVIMIACIGFKAAWVIPIHMTFGALTVYLGIKHPLHAAAEEFIRYILFTLPLILYTLVVL